MCNSLRNFILTALVVAVVPFNVNAQGGEPQYLSSVLTKADKKEASYYRNSSGKAGDHFVGKTYSIDGVLKVEGTYADKELSIEDGFFTYYHANGKVESKGNYEMGLKAGIWQRFDVNGNALAEKIYDIAVLENIVYTMAQTMPRYKGGDEKVFVHYIKSNVVNSVRTKIKGSVTASFIVEKNGELSTITVIGSDDRNVEAKVRQAIEATSPWDVGVEKGRVVRVQMQVPIKF